ncbi:MAG TPA: PAS domain S-box protein [Vicinamibacterales bacterium]|nr:PAS domain S-box protein [Vicinamibacterales bacterium]
MTLLEVSRDHSEITVAYSWSAPGTGAAPPAIAQSALPWWVGQVLGGHVSLASYVDDLPDEAVAEKEFLRQEGVVSAASIPLRVGGEIAGVISFLTLRRHVKWTDELVNQLRAIGDILWNALKRRQAMQALLAAQIVVRESEERFRLAMNNVAAGVYTLDRNGLLTYVNPAAETMFGWTNAELLGRQMHEVTHFKHADGTPYPASECPALHVLQTGIELREYEDVFVRKDGRLFPVVFSASPLKKDGTTVGIVVGFRDETLRRDAERTLRESEALRASEERYRGLAEQVVDGIIIISAEGQALDANRAACEMFGYTLDELKDLRLENGIADEDLPKLPATLERLARENVVRGEWLLKRKDGSVFAAEVVGRRLPDGRLQAAIRDITERKEGEDVQRRLHQLAVLPLEADVGEVLGAIVETAIAIAHADFGTIELFDAQSSSLRIVTQRGFPQWWIDYWQSVPEGRGTSGAALEQRERVIVEDVEQSSIFSPSDLEMHRQAGVRAVQSTPLVSRSGRFIGMLSTHFRKPGRPDERRLLLFDLLAREAADAIGYARSEKDLKRQAALLDLAHNAIFVRDQEGCVTHWSEGAVRCYGWSKEEALGRVSHTLLQTRFSEPRARIEAIVARTGRWEGELVQTCRDGRQIVVDSRWAIQRDDGRAGYRILEINNDITARKQAEAALRESQQQLQSYIDQAGDGIYVIDGQSGRILSANARAAQMLRYSRDELLQLSDADIECMYTREEIYGFHRASQKGVVKIEGIHKRKDGSRFPVEVSLASLAPASPHRVLAIVRDVSERKRLEDERAEEARRKEEFLAVLGHELRNPLAAIHTAVDVLSGGGTPEQRARMEEMIGRQTTLMRRLVDDLLDHERITRGHIELKPERVDLAACLQRAVAAVNVNIASRKQELHLRLPPEPVLFIADGARLDQIVSNLLSNASKYTASGGSIELSGTRVAGQVVIRCKDNGQGIPREYQQRIFEAFARGPKTELGYGEASVGLGLALVKQLTELHGGTISVESAGTGLGSEFTVRLPFLAPPPDQTTAEKPKPHQVKQRCGSVVLVEDNPSVAAALKARLEQAGHAVYVFPDGPSALAGVSGLTPDALVIDIGLPGMDGYELGTALRQRDNTRDALCIAVSGFKRRAIGDGDPFDRYFNKPIDVPALLALLDEAPDK